MYWGRSNNMTDFARTRWQKWNRARPQLPTRQKSILRKEVKLKYTTEPTIVVPRKLISLIISEFHNAKGHQGISHTDNMMRHFFWWIGMQRDIHQHINSCKLCIQLLSNRIYMQLMHLEIPQVPFASWAMDCNGPLPTSSKGHRHVLMFICLLTSYLVTVPLKTKWQMKSPWPILRKSSPKLHVLNLFYMTVVLSSTMNS